MNYCGTIHSNENSVNINLIYLYAVELKSKFLIISSLSFLCKILLIVKNI